MHRLLIRQLKKYLPINKKSYSEKDLQKLFDTISVVYDSFDKDIKMINRSLELSSKEMGDINKKLEQKIELANKRTKELEYLNEVMVGRELKMIDLKEKINNLEKNLHSIESNKKTKG